MSIKNYLFSYTDLRSIQRAKLVPSTAFDKGCVDGVGFAGFASWLDLVPGDSDVIAVPDSAPVVYPNNSEIAWVATELQVEGRALEQCPRYQLKRLLKELNGLGYVLKTGVEAEFFLISNNSNTIYDDADTYGKPCYNQDILLKNYGVISAIVEGINSLGWGCYQADHEDANGQYEINWEFDDSLATADKHAFFKSFAKQTARDNEARVSFMPKPFPTITGNGCHCHFSVWSLDGKNEFLGQGGELSQLAKSFAAGVLQHAPALALLFNSSVNSYRRQQATQTDSGSSWVTNRVSVGGNDRTKLVRIPDNERIELRQPDGAVNPYILQLGVLAGGLLGLKNSLSLDKVASSAGLLPTNLGAAILNFQKDLELQEVLGSDFSSAYLNIKHREWEEYLNHFSSWEVSNYLDL